MDQFADPSDRIGQLMSPVVSVELEPGTELLGPSNPWSTEDIEALYTPITLASFHLSRSSLAPALSDKRSTSPRAV